MIGAGSAADSGDRTRSIRASNAQRRGSAGVCVAGCVLQGVVQCAVLGVVQCVLHKVASAHRV